MSTNHNNNNNNAKNAFAFLDTCYFAHKTHGGGGATGTHATYNDKQKRLTLGAYWYNLGYHSGRVALDGENRVIVVLSKNNYDAQNTAYHATRHFITVQKTSTARDVLDNNGRAVYGVDDLGENPKTSERVLVLTK